MPRAGGVVLASQLDHVCLPARLCCARVGCWIPIPGSLPVSLLFAAGSYTNTLPPACADHVIFIRAIQFITLIQASPPEGLSQHYLYRSLGVSLTFEPPPEDVRRDVLNQVSGQAETGSRDFD